ncbi:hypothetical protein Psed_4339 [Pseudonocardia dioxanivorans CB1190]|uniref:Uncharacterized protein n=1 Tax=Pseudonocardia dioxanivorans (strain ATCC 55486 / DSM 44775 / JCM 13855 / CB1190) TaxID=675635 RepID=F4CXC4_PSEUX|nr:hypothetical protein [Pseudonocardia dioxanivorans]AEA26498.1 hypothetical protein Psed_4339 [Pseudonocardia dioxanivorans CB1190]
MSDDQPDTPTVRDRATAAGIPETRLLTYVERGLLLLDGDVVCELDQPAPPGTRLLVTGS